MKKFVTLLLAVTLLSATLSGCCCIPSQSLPGDFSLDSLLPQSGKEPALVQPDNTLPIADPTEATEEDVEPTESVKVPEFTYPSVETPTAPPQPVFRTVGGNTSGTNLHVRKGPGTDYKIVERLEEKGTRLTFYDVEYVGDDLWGNVGYGWVSMNFVVLDDPSVIPYSQSGHRTAVTLGNPLRIYEGPGTQYASYSTYPLHTTVDIWGFSGRWAKTDRGWISLDEISLN